MFIAIVFGLNERSEKVSGVHLPPMKPTLHTENYSIIITKRESNIYYAKDDYYLLFRAYQNDTN